jgi:hypothetical protein
MTGTAACVMAPSGMLVGVGHTCTLGADECQPGLVCQADNCGSRCYKYCNSDLDCPNSTCSRAGGGSYKVCDVPFADCNPIGASMANCGATQLACYISAKTVDKTVCDCAGSGIGTTPCTNSRDCLPGNICVDVGGGNFQCMQACRLDGTGMQCPAGPAQCSRYLNNTSTTFGYCF